MEMTWLSAVVVAANVLGATMAVPQATRIHRTRSAQGVSLAWAIMSTTINGWWGVYGLAVGDLAIVPVSFVSVTVYLAIAVMVVRSSDTSATQAFLTAVAASAVVSSLPIVAMALGGWQIAGIVLGGLYGVQLAPAVVAVYRSADVSGVSPATWIIALVEAALWGVHGIAAGDTGIVTLAVTGVSMSTLVLARLAVHGRRRDRGGTSNVSPVLAAA
jgi:uncharacterized protein with PQ loop repeat